MSKIRFSKYIALIGGLSLIPTSGLSAWYFSNINHVHELDVQIGVDDIEENYSFHDTSIEEETYTIYFYPSILYMFMSDTQINSIGYVDVTTNADGKASFNTTNVNDVAYKDIVKSNTFFLDDRYNKVSDGSEYYHTFVYGMDDNNGLYSDVTYDNPHYDPSSDEKEFYIGYAEESGTYPSIPGVDYDGRYPRYMHLYDRFGYWRDRNYTEGRYSPIRISGITTLSSGLFAQAISTPYCDMSDPNGYYINYFSAWTSQIYSTNEYEYEYGCFQNADLDMAYVFDVLEGLDRYDGNDNDNVIRLYPFFTCGKNYDPDATRTEGMRDAIRATVNGGEEHYMFYTTDGGENGYTYNGVPSVKYASLLNVNVEDENFTLKIDLSFCEGSVSYSGWENCFYDDLHPNPKITANDININTNGPGLYNFYVAIGNCGLFNGGVYDLPWEGTGRESVPDVNIDGIFNSDTFDGLSRKRLTEITFGLYAFDELGGYLWNRDDGFTRPMVIAYEKVVDIKLIHNIASDNNDIDGYVDSVYNQMPNFINSASSDTFTDINGSELTFSYAYVLRNVDLIEEYNTHFQIRFGNIYNISISIAEPPSSIILNGRTFQPYTTYFNELGTNMVDEQRVSSPTRDEYYSIYDFILTYPGSGDSLNLYAYRHENLFVKIFENNPDKNNDGFAIHSSSTSAEQDYGLIWKATFASGDYVDLTDFDENNNYLGNTLINYFNDNNITSCYIKDRVSGVIVFTYQNDQLSYSLPTNNGRFVIEKNYIFYLDSINAV